MTRWISASSLQRIEEFACYVMTGSIYRWVVKSGSYHESCSLFFSDLVDKGSLLLTEEHELESVEVTEVGSLLEACSLACPGGLLVLSKDISLSESLGEGTSADTAWDLKLDWGEGEVAEWDGLASDTSHRAINQSLIKDQSTR